VAAPIAAGEAAPVAPGDFAAARAALESLEAK
jgi:hypothetical protein